MVRKSLLFGLVVVALLGAGTAQAAPYKLGNQHWPAWIPSSVAAQKGFYKKNGVDIVEVAIPDYDTMIKSLATGKTQFGVGMIGDFLKQKAQGAPITVVAELDWSNGGDKILISNRLASLKDLKGKKVGADKGTTSYFFLLKALQKVGLTEKDVVVVQATAEQAAARAGAGQLDAAVTWEPDASMAVKKGKVKVALTSKQIPGVMPEMLAVHDSLLKNPKAIVGAIRGWVEGAAYVAKKPADLRAIANKGGYQGDYALKSDAEMWEGLSQMAIHNPKTMLARMKGPIQAYVKEYNQYLLRQGLIKKAVPPQALINTSFLEQAVK